MTEIRIITPDELPAFISAATASDHRDDIGGYVRSMLERGAMRSEWCYVAEASGVAVGRIALWTLPKVDQPLSLVLLDCKWERTDAHVVATSLLDRAVADARAQGATSLEYVIDEPSQWPQWQGHLEDRERTLDGRAELRRVTARFELRTGDEFAVTGVPSGVTFRTLPDVGEASFLEALERVSAGSLDRYTIAERDRLGPTTEARQTFDDLTTMEYEPVWWELAYDPAGRLIGLVMPARSPTFATIGYIGVVPEMRGHGYVDALLARGTVTMRTPEREVIRADTDIENAPMAAAFGRAGYRRFAVRHEYVVAVQP